MPNRKITELLEDTTPTPDELILVVSSPSSTPIPKKMQLSTLFGNITFTTVRTSTDKALVSALLRANVAHASNFAAAGQFIVSKGAAVTGNAQFGVIAKSLLTANAVIGTMAGAFVSVDPGTASALTSNSTYGLLVHAAQASGTRASAPAAFIGIGEESAVNAPTQLLMDVGRPGFSVSGNSTTVNSSAVFSQATSTTIGFKLKIRVNGTAYWVCLTSAV